MELFFARFQATGDVIVLLRTALLFLKPRLNVLPQSTQVYAQQRCVGLRTQESPDHFQLVTMLRVVVDKPHVHLKEAL